MARLFAQHLQTSSTHLTMDNQRAVSLFMRRQVCMIKICFDMRYSSFFKMTFVQLDELDELDRITHA